MPSLRWCGRDGSRDQDERKHGQLDHHRHHHRGVVHSVTTGNFPTSTRPSSKVLLLRTVSTRCLHSASPERTVRTRGAVPSDLMHAVCGAGGDNDGERTMSVSVGVSDDDRIQVCSRSCSTELVVRQPVLLTSTHTELAGCTRVTAVRSSVINCVRPPALSQVERSGGDTSERKKNGVDRTGQVTSREKTTC
jgi:hypothetical protein